jgi:phosphomannomutase
MSIKFGTDGWRAIIGKDYTFDNLSIVAQATARWILEEKITDNGVVIGHDGRFLGREFSEHVASVFAAMDIPVRFADRICPTPAVSWAALEHDAVGIVITASHNPPAYNGFKIKAPFGGPATPEQIAAVEKRYDAFDPSLKVLPFETYQREGLIREIPLTDQFEKVLEERLDLNAIRESGIKIAHDSMFGAAQGVVKSLLPEQTFELHADFNPGFHGQAPEPIEKNLGELSSFIVDEGCAIGLANDGDADRIGMYDERGVFVDSHKILSLLVKYLSQEKGMSGSIIKTFSTTNMLNRQAEKYGLEIETTPIGFKYVAEKIVQGDVLVGGEESGGLAVKGHIPERDGIYIGLLITEMMVKSGKPLSELVHDLAAEFGAHHQYRNDLHTSDQKKKAMMEYCKSESFKEIAGHQVVEWQQTDGVKHLMADGSWLLVRPSGTEPVLRIYSEADSEEKAVALVEAASAKAESF